MARYHITVASADGDEESMYPCDHFTRKIVREGSLAGDEGLAPVGILLELTKRDPKDPEAPPTITELRLPDDGHVAYIMDSRGDTIHTYRWKSAI